MIRASTYVGKAKFSGIVIDFEQIAGSDAKNLTVFIRELSARFFPQCLKVLTAAPLDDANLDYEEIAAASSQLILMAYDEHDDRGGLPGPVAGQGWFETHLDERLRTLDRSKVIVGLGAYGHDWSVAEGRGVSISVQKAWDLLAELGARLTFDAASLNPSFAYVDSETGDRREIWFLDAVTAFNQATAAMAMEPHGIAVWRLGSEDPGIWQVLGRGHWPVQGSITALAKLAPGYGISYQGLGEVLKVTSLEKEGKRAVEYSSETHLIVSELVEAFPKLVAVSRRGARSDKVVSLTFDDGPDPASTPAILDILAAKNVRGSFFIFGANATARPDILRRIYSEGHDVGNHTYTHPDLASIRRGWVDLNSAQPKGPSRRYSEYTRFCSVRPMWEILRPRLPLI